MTLPLGAKWGNNIGGVAACLNWSGGRGAQNPPPHKSDFSSLTHTNNNYQKPPKHNNYKSKPKNVYYATTDPVGQLDSYYYDGRSDDKYLNIIPWQEDLGLARAADGKLKIAKNEQLGGYYGDGGRHGVMTPPSRPATGGRYGGRTVRTVTPKG